MGGLKWAAYQPEDINWSARDRVKAWERHDIESTVSNKQPSTHTKSGLVFLILALSVLTISLAKFVLQ